MQGRPSDGIQVSLVVTGLEPVHTNDHDLGGERRWQRAEELAHRNACLRLTALLDRILKVEGDPIRGASQGFGEQLGARSRNEQLAAHHDVSCHRSPRA